MIGIEFAGYRSGTSWAFLLLLFLIIRPTRRTRLDQIIFWVGNASVVYIITIALLAQMYSIKNSGTYILMGVIPYILLMMAAIVRFYGENNNISSFSRQVYSMFRNIFLYLLLPAALVTAILLFLAFSFGWIK